MQINPSEYRIEAPQRSAALPIDATEHRHPFLLAHHPDNWEHVAGFGWLPVIRRLHIVSGVNGVRNGDASGMVLDLQSRGYVVLRNEQHSYMGKYQTRTGPAYLDRWTTIVKLNARRSVPRRSEEGQREYNEWRAGLVTSGEIEMPAPEWLAEIVDRYEERARRRYVDIHNPQVAAKVAELEQRAAEMRADIDVATGKAKPAKRGK